MLGGVGTLGVWNEQAHFLIGSSPFWVQLTVVAEWHQSPEDVDGEKSDGKGNEAHCLQTAVEVQVVLSPPQTQPPRDSRKGCYEKEAHHVAEEGALLIPGPRVPEPLCEGSGSALDGKLRVA